MTLDEAREHVGSKVVYRTSYGRTEEGVITSVMKTFVFVRYGSDSGSKATQPESLTLRVEAER